MNDPQVGDAGRIAPTRCFNESEGTLDGPDCRTLRSFQDQVAALLAARLQGRGIRLIVGSYTKTRRP
jgi:hypothetical protein